MTAKEFVISKYPDAYLEQDGNNHPIFQVFANPDAGFPKVGIVIGDGLTPDKAWEDAKQWIEDLPKTDQ